MTRLSLFSCLAVVGFTIAPSSQSEAADPPESRRVKAIRETVLPAKIKFDIDKKMLRPIIFDDLPTAIKEVTKLTVKIDVAPGLVALAQAARYFQHQRHARGVVVGAHVG